MILGSSHILVERYVIGILSIIVGINVCFCAIPGRARLVRNWSRPCVFVGGLRTSGGVGSRIFLAMVFVRSYWIVGIIDVERLVMKDHVHLVVPKVFINVNVGRWKWRGSVLRGSIGARIRARGYLVVGNMFVIAGVIRVYAESVHFKGRGRVLVERGSMKAWLVMLQFRLVGPLAIKR